MRLILEETDASCIMRLVDLSPKIKARARLMNVAIFELIQLTLEINVLNTRIAAHLEWRLDLVVAALGRFLAVQATLLNLRPLTFVVDLVPKVGAITMAISQTCESILVSQLNLCKCMGKGVVKLLGDTKQSRTLLHVNWQPNFLTRKTPLL